MLPIIYLPREISDQIIHHAKSHWRETGGVVIGYRWNDSESNQLKFLIHYVSDEGKEINVSSGHFNGDMDYFSQKVEEWQTSQDAEFLGIWHSHPEGVNQLSGGDFHSVQRVFEFNPDLPIFLAPLVVYTPDNDREILFFYINSLQKHFTRIPPETNVIFTTSEEFADLREEALAGRNQ
jgi:proteasome lid subunit RPN8/RPN11